ncbi:hypothetical protein BOX15_Mlig001517g6 [Macrostomum lignano]|uniref:Cyclic nucleotide-binding domain-containing protein n=1 Tax=Macrostomum lignano TaxID=282301 RepID=A0A267DJU4_9PLAT|nr:hypothetical protein BOX15_Mlig001517g6 [Macrostomum lignano]
MPTEQEELTDEQQEGLSERAAPLTNQHASEKGSRDSRSRGSSHFSTDVFRGSSMPFWEDDDEVSNDNVVSPRSGMIQACNLDEMSESDFIDTKKDCNKTSKEIAEIIKQINSLVLFQGYEDKELKSVIGYMYRRKVTKGEVVIKQGDVGDAFFVIRSGKYDCTVMKGGKSTRIRTYEGSGYFGDLALVNHAPRAASITALTDGELWVLNATRYVWLKKNQAVRNAECFERVIRQIPLFSNNLTDSHVNSLIDAIEVLTMHKGDVICRQGEPGDAMYFILDGSVSVLVGGKQVRTMGANEFFGERALVLDEGRAATCSALSDVKLAKLPKESFEMLIPDSVVASMREYVAKAYAKTAQK